ncbi:chromosome partitioning protein [Methylobacterium sp. J-092]|uniref:chromosome partitioning protein n=1 Tax=Methylobacterium sp. J-092 TaxID=2836667 RepID=UPI001FBA422B|nr:chromosome partitioning protein [Methylobacterium sp. J-092]MCJ2005546.1 chromosome partitioning protein [Methylobacterium sp. J-092]
MPRILLVAQETGGVGKSTITRGLAEAVPDAAILEIESTHRLTEFPSLVAEAGATGKGRSAKGPSGEAQTGGVRHFPMRATREAIEASGGKAARAELDPVINALYTATGPTLVDIGANTSASLLGILADEAKSLREGGIELGLVVIVAAEAGALADAGKLLHGAKDWAARFVVANAVRGAVDPVILKRVVGDATVAQLRGFDLEDKAREVLAAGGLRGIVKLDRAGLAAQTSPAEAGRILRDLTAFRLAVMEVVKPAALWLVQG